MWWPIMTVGMVAGLWLGVCLMAVGCAGAPEQEQDRTEDIYTLWMGDRED